MGMVSLIVGAAWAGYLTGRLSPDPFAPWERTLRQRTFEWRVWWISERIKRAEAHRAALEAAWHEESF